MARAHRRRAADSHADTMWHLIISTVTGEHRISVSDEERAKDLLSEIHEHLRARGPVGG
jgi:hypothetical protein